MKKLILLFGFTIVFSCDGIFNSDLHEVNYAFVNAEKISDIDKKNTTQVLEKRLRRFSKQVEVRLNSKNEINLKLSGAIDIERLNKIVEDRGKLDFWPCLNSKAVFYFIRDVDEVLQTDAIPKPLSSLVMPSSYDEIYISVNDTLRARQLLNDDRVKTLFKSENKDLKFLFGKPTEELVVLYGVTSNETGRSRINETTIVEAIQDYDQIDRPAISIVMNEFGSHIWKTMTNDAYLNSSRIAIAINDIVYSAPTVSAGPISGGKSQISGNFNLEEAQNLAYILSSQRSIPQLKFVNHKKIENQ